jgi:hypothetical protein
MTQADFTLFLEQISLCFIQDDVEMLRSCAQLPFTLITKTGPVTLQTDQEFRSYFEMAFKSIAIMRVDQIIRRVVSLEDCKDGTFIGTYETETLSHGQRVETPYISSALLHTTAQGWKASSIMNAQSYLE